MVKLQKSGFEGKYIYHYTTRECARKILKERVVKCYGDKFTFFTSTYEDSVKVFENVMQEGTLYIDDHLRLRKREWIDPNDYVILKLQCLQKEEFYQLVMKHEEEEFSAYDYSLMHVGNLTFQKGKVLPLKEKSFANGRKAVYKAAVIGGTCLLLGMMASGSVYAASDAWIDNGNYDISWYTESGSSFQIEDEADLAGLSYLAQNDDLSGKTFTINRDMDLSTKEWKTIPESFQGKIEGSHRILLSCGEIFAADTESIDNGLMIQYQKNEGEEKEGGQEGGCDHDFETVFVKEATESTDAVQAGQCRKCGELAEYESVSGTACVTFLQNAADEIRKTKSEEVILNTEIWTCFDERVIDAMKERTDVAVTIHYKYMGKKYVVTIPAGSSVDNLLDENGYCGFRYLDLLFGGKEE